MGSDKKIRVGITCGDLNGIGMEVIIKTMMDSRVTEVCTPVLFASSKVVSYHRKAMNAMDFSFNIINKIEDMNDKRSNLVNIWKEDVNLEFGKASQEVAAYAVKSLQAATDAYKAGHIDAIITAPINKHTIQSDAFNYQGHTEYYAKEFEGKSLMLLCTDHLKVAVATGHIPLKDVAQKLSKELILEKIKILNHSLKQDFGIVKPKIAVMGLNPHRGDEGLIGKEEIDFIDPAVQEAFEQGIYAFGSFSADGFFGTQGFRTYDAVLAMYHDQGLIPFKALAFNSGVNFTAGLSVIRTSPDHGPAYDLAGKNIAEENSFKQALWMACDIARNRGVYQEINSNPLPISKKQRDTRD